MVLHLFHDVKAELGGHLYFGCFILQYDTENRVPGIENSTLWDIDRTVIKKDEKLGFPGRWEKFVQHLYINGDIPIPVELMMRVDSTSGFVSIDCRVFVEIHYLS